MRIDQRLRFCLIDFVLNNATCPTSVTLGVKEYNELKGSMLLLDCYDYDAMIILGLKVIRSGDKTRLVMQ